MIDLNSPDRIAESVFNKFNGFDGVVFKNNKNESGILDSKSSSIHFNRKAVLNDSIKAMELMISVCNKHIYDKFGKLIESDTHKQLNKAIDILKTQNYE